MALKATRKRGGMRAGVHAVEYYSIDGAGNEGPVGACQVTLSRVAL